MARRRERKEIAELIGELRNWLPNYDHGAQDYPTLLFRILASLPGGDELEDMGFETFAVGWHEADQLGRVLTAIQGKEDVEALVRGLLAEEEQDVGEPRARPAMREPYRTQNPATRTVMVPVRPGGIRPVHRRPARALPPARRR